MSNTQSLLDALRQSLVVERGFRPIERSLPQAGAAAAMVDACLVRQSEQDLLVHALLADHGYSSDGLLSRHQGLREALTKLEGSVPGRLKATLWVLAPDSDSAAKDVEALAKAEPGHFLAKTLLGAGVLDAQAKQAHLVRGEDSEPALGWFEAVLRRGEGPGESRAEAAIQSAEAEEREVRDLVGGPKPWGTWVLIGLCCFAFVVQVLFARALSDGLLQSQPEMKNSWSLAYSQAIRSLGANSHEAVFGQGEYWRLLASVFLHADLLHLLMNMMALLSIGALLERLCGWPRLLGLFIITGLAGSFLSAALSREGMALGASGAILGLAGALMAPKVRRPKGMPKALADRLFGSLARPIGILLGLGLLLNLLGTPLQFDNWSHLGGLVSGFGIALGFPGLFKRRRT